MDFFLVSEFCREMEAGGAGRATACMGAFEEEAAAAGLIVARLRPMMAGERDVLASDKSTP